MLSHPDLTQQYRTIKDLFADRVSKLRDGKAQIAQRLERLQLHDGVRDYPSRISPCNPCYSPFAIEN
jgi:hypothetical protein